jgi:hypothetical protein
MSNWLEIAFDKLDASFARLTRPCPKCGGQLHRTFSLLDKLGLFIPLPHTIYARHQCEQCKTRFRSYRTLTDLFLEGSWVAACAYLGEFRLLALACPATWLICSRLVKDTWTEGADTVAAGVLTGVLWLLSLVFGGGMRHAYLLEHNVLMFLLTALLVLGPVWLVLFLDKYTTFGLVECED